MLCADPHATPGGIATGRSAHANGADAPRSPGLQRALHRAIWPVCEKRRDQIRLGPEREALFWAGCVGRVCAQAAGHHDCESLFHSVEHSGGRWAGHLCRAEEEHLG